MEVGDRIRRARNERGLSQRELGKLIGISGSAIAQWEGGGAITKTPKLDNLLLAAQALGLPLGDLLQNGNPGLSLELTDADEIALVMLFRAMKAEQKAIHLSLFYSSTGISEPPKKQRHPGDRNSGVVGAGVVHKPTGTG